MKKLVSFCLAAILFSACSSPKISPEPIAEQVIPQFDLSQSYYAHFVVRFEDGTSATINSIELDASHWTVGEAERTIPNIVPIQEALGYEAFETLRGKPVKGTEISINTAASMSSGGSGARTATYCGIMNAPPICTCIDDLAFRAMQHPSLYAYPVVGGYYVYCDQSGSGQIDGVVYLSLETINALF